MGQEGGQGRGEGESSGGDVRVRVCASGCSRCFCKLAGVCGLYPCSQCWILLPRASGHLLGVCVCVCLSGHLCVCVRARACVCCGFGLYCGLFCICVSIRGSWRVNSWRNCWARQLPPGSHCGSPLLSAVWGPGRAMALPPGPAALLHSLLLVPGLLSSGTRPVRSLAERFWGPEPPRCVHDALGAHSGLRARFPSPTCCGSSQSLVREPQCPAPQPAVPLQLDSARSKNSMEPP